MQTRLESLRDEIKALQEALSEKLREAGTAPVLKAHRQERANHLLGDPDVRHAQRLMLDSAGLLTRKELWKDAADVYTTAIALCLRLHATAQMGQHGLSDQDARGLVVKLRSAVLLDKQTSNELHVALDPKRLDQKAVDKLAEVAERLVGLTHWPAPTASDTQAGSVAKTATA